MFIRKFVVLKGVMIVLLVLFFQDAVSQVSLDWEDLAHGVEFKEGNSIPGFLNATFRKNMAELEGKEVTLNGYFLALDASESAYMLSKNPMASCFFCGNGGPETVVELRFSNPPKFKTDDVLSVAGTLLLNTDDPEHCYYIIEDADAFTLK
ncbi:hypothetical protein [Pricia sp.]|uniref:hypothetical protein n=1 Tax=Pricia sp. TaxID=2268138 RepID=UPI003592FD56